MQIHTYEMSKDISFCKRTDRLLLIIWNHVEQYYSITMQSILVAKLQENLKKDFAPWMAAKQKWWTKRSTLAPCYERLRWKLLSLPFRLWLVCFFVAWLFWERPYCSGINAGQYRERDEGHTRLHGVVAITFVIYIK